MRLTILLLTVPAIAWAMQLPPEMEADRFLLQAEGAIEEQDFERAKTTMDRILELQAEHNLELPEQFPFRYAQVLERLGLHDDAMDAATRYLTLVGRDGEFYREALELLNAAEAGKAAAEAAAAEAETDARAAAETAARSAGETRVFDGIEFVWVPAGEFQMGSTSSDSGDNERPVTRVRISRGFWLGKFEITQAEWQAVIGTNPSRYSTCGLCPVETVSWYDAQDFIERLNGQAGGNHYRLPTEAEWEYAARAGTTGDRYGNMDAITWNTGNSGDHTHLVGEKLPNAWGLYDMLGNVWEWVEDWNGDYPGGFVADPRGPRSGLNRITRGGGWGASAFYQRATARFPEDPSYRSEVPGLPSPENQLVSCHSSSVG